LVAAVTAVANGVTGVTPSLVVNTSQEPVSVNSKTGYLKPPVVVSTVSGIMARHKAEAEATLPPSQATPAPDSASAVAGATASPAPGRQQATFSYTVQEGDTVSSIAQAYGVDPAYILWNNPEIADPNFLLVGEKILVPSVNGIVYHVTVGDTLSDIASYYQIDVQSITGFVPNNLTTPDSVLEGMVLLLPGAVPPPPPIPAAVDIISEPPADSGFAGDDSGPLPAGNPGPASSTGFSWPYYGPITTYFGEARGSGYHKGIDIDGFGNYGAGIAAAADGIVVLAAWDDWGLGYHIIVEHADGSRTVYGHLSDMYVSQGQYVGSGEIIGALGSTGYSTGPHLHFEIWVGGGPVDPLGYLP
jgi:murein DD-endopeptidase MepM/ murein hydrolase activator NlpD